MIAASDCGVQLPPSGYERGSPHASGSGGRRGEARRGANTVRSVTARWFLPLTARRFIVVGGGDSSVAACDAEPPLLNGAAAAASARSGSAQSRDKKRPPAPRHRNGHSQGKNAANADDAILPVADTAVFT